MNSVDFGRAFTYVFQDRDWIKKVLIGGIMVLLSFVLIGAFILAGYVVEIVRRVASGNDVPLPEWDDIGGYLSRGFLATVGLLIWFLPFILVYCCVVIFSVGIDTDSASIAGNFVLFILWGIAIIYSAVIPPMVIGQYAINGTFQSMFQFDQIIAGIQRVGAGLVMVVLISFVANIVSSAGLIACFIGVIFTAAYSYFVIAHAYGQVARIAFGSEHFSETTDRPAF